MREEWDLQPGTTLFHYNLNAYLYLCIQKDRLKLEMSMKYNMFTGIESTER